MAKKKQAEEKPNTQAAAAETETETTPPQAEENNQTQTDDPTAALEKELADTKDQLLRLTAEYANFRKRSDKEKGDTYAYATGKTVEAFLPVFDNLERALGATQQDFEGLQKGVQMTFDGLTATQLLQGGSQTVKGLTATLEKLGVTAYGAPGETFDPNLHHAVMHVEDENLDENVITDVFQRGYKMDDRIIRPAMVKTAN